MAPVQQVPLEVQLAQGLAGNEPASRDKTFETLRKFVRLQLPHLDEPLTNNDFIKIWKGIHYRLWMQDKPLLQEKLVDQICQLLPLFPTEEYSMMYIRSFFETETREWNGIDQLRMDKYMMLVREFVNSIFVFLCKSGWKEDLIKQLNVILEETVFNFDSVMQPHSLQLHLIDIYPLELMKVVDGQFSPDIATTIFSVFIHVFPVVRNVSVINKLFTLLQNTIFEKMSPGDRTKKKRKVLNGIQERDVTHFENNVKLAVDRKQFLSLLLDTASNERGSFKRRNQLYNLIKRIKTVELNKSSEKEGEEGEKPKKKKKSKKAKVAAIRDVDVEGAALELKKFEEKLSEDIPSQKRLKGIQRRQEKLEKKLKKKAAKNNVEKKKEEEEEADDDEEEEEEVVAAEFIQFEADEEGDSDGEWIDGDDDDDDDYDMFNDEDLDDSFIVDDDEEEEEDGSEEEDDDDGSEEEEEVEGVADEEDDSEEDEVVTPRKKQKTSHVKKGSVLNNVISDDEEEEEEDYGYDEEDEEGSDDGLEYDVEEAFLNLEMDSEDDDDVDDDDDGDEEKEDKSESNKEDDDDDVGCYVVDVSTDTCGDDDDDDDNDDDEDQNIQSKPTQNQTVCDKKKKTKKKKKKKSVDISKSESEASSSSSERKCSEEEEKKGDSEDTIEKRMKMMVDMMMMESDNETKEDVSETKGDAEETKTKQKRKKKKNKNKTTGKVESNKAGTDATSNNMFTLVDFEEEGQTEDKSLVVEKAATNGEITHETSTKRKKKQKKKKQQEKELTSTSAFPLPTGVECSPKVQEVVHQLKSIMNDKQMRRTEGADKKMKKKLSRYFEMVSKDNLLHEVSSDVPNGNTDQSEMDFIQDGIKGLDQHSKDKKKSKKRKRKPDQQKENLTKFCESPPAFFQVAVSKVKKPSKQKNKTPKSIPESCGFSLDRKSVSFDMKQNKAFLPETPISSGTPYNSQKKPKIGILKPSPSPILVRKQKKKKTTTTQLMKRPKASDFF